jgi:glycosyltransferase involved in cell wall biosynthesis
MNPIKLSYVITTYNKLPYLKEVMRLLLLNKKIDEEIVVADGGSTDGTVEFLDGLFKEGGINQFVSEKDKGEAHGYNKTFLMARGDLIKVITDDDVFYYPAIEACRNYMEENPSIDLMTGMAAMVLMGSFTPIQPIQEFFEEYKKWEQGKIDRFYSNGLALLLRKSSMPLLGLFSNEITYVDIEYILRVSKWANIAFCNQCIAVRITNVQSKGFVQTNSKEEVIKLFNFYNYPIPLTWQAPKKEKKPFLLELRIFLSRAKKKLQGLPAFQPTKETFIKNLSPKQIEEFYAHYEQELDKANQQIQILFFKK